MPIDLENQEEKAGRLRAFKSTAYKYGIAMIVLVLNSLIAPILFSLILSPLYLFAKKNSDAYYTVLLLLNDLSAYVLPILILRAVFSRERADFVPDRTYCRIPAESVLLFLAGTAAGSIGSILTQLIGSILDALFGTGEIPEAFSGMKPQNPFQFVAFTVCICVVAPLCEEYLFRDILLKPMRRFHDLAASLLAGLIFGLYHGNFDQFAYAALLGFFYSVIAVRANSILPSTLCHAANNLLVCFTSYLSEAIPELQGMTGLFAAAVNLLIPAGIAASVAVLYKKCLKLHSHDLFLSGRDLTKGLLTSPAVLIGLAVMLAVFFI